MRHFKKIWGPLLIGLTLLGGSPLHALEVEAADPAKPCEGVGTTLTEKYLFCIRQYTNDILGKVNTLPDYIDKAEMYFTSWVSTKETDKSIVPALQANFTKFTNDFTTNSDEQKKLQKNIVDSFFKDPTNPKGFTALTGEQLPNANDLEYQILFDIPYLSTDPRNTQQTKIDSPLNYIFNASSLNVIHPYPEPQWNPKDPIQRQRYINYYSTVSAVQTYNAYILSELYANKKNNFSLNDTQKKLIDQVTGPDWLKQVGSDSVGLTLRHILLFDSQIFVLLARMLEVQKQMLTSQAMTNSLLVVLNMGNEDMLVKKANGTLSIP